MSTSVLLACGEHYATPEPAAFKIIVVNRRLHQLTGIVGVMAILQQSTRRIGFLREVIGVIPAVGVDVSQCEAVVAKHAPIRIDAV